METSQIIAENIKRIRTEQGLSLGQLAELSGVSKVILSQIEKGNSNPTVNTMWKIANGLQVPGTQLFEAVEPEEKIIRFGDVQSRMKKDASYKSYTYYHATNSRPFDWFLVEVEARSWYESIGHNDGSIEHIYVISGILEIVVGEERHKLHPGDSMYFEGVRSHVYVNLSDELLKLISVVYYTYK